MSAPNLYLDPGSGSYLLQLLIAGIVGLIFALRGYRTRVVNFLRNLFGMEEDGEEE